MYVPADLLVRGVLANRVVIVIFDYCCLVLEPWDIGTGSAIYRLLPFAMSDSIGAILFVLRPKELLMKLW